MIIFLFDLLVEITFNFSFLAYLFQFVAILEPIKALSFSIRAQLIESYFYLDRCFL
jgi:hypothetical protein